MGKGQRLAVKRGIQREDGSWARHPTARVEEVHIQGIALCCYLELQDAPRLRIGGDLQPGAGVVGRYDLMESELLVAIKDDRQPVLRRVVERDSELVAVNCDVERLVIICGDGRRAGGTGSRRTTGTM